MLKRPIGAAPAALAVVVAAAATLAGCQGGAPLGGPPPAPLAAEAAGPTPPADAATAATRHAASRREARALGMGLVDARDLEQYANRVARQIVDENGLSGKVAAAVVIGADRTVNAFVNPDGLIVVPIGLLMDLGREDELAFVLGHEIAHVELGHHDRTWLQQNQQHAVRMIETATRVEDALGYSVRGFEGTEGGLDAAYAKAQAYLTAADRVLLAFWSRKQEREADERGRALMKGAGYNPNAIGGVFAVMRVWQGQDRAALTMLKEGLSAAQIDDRATLGDIGRMEEFLTGEAEAGDIQRQAAPLVGQQGRGILGALAKAAAPLVNQAGLAANDLLNKGARNLDVGHPSVEDREADMERLNQADPFKGTFKAVAYLKAVGAPATKPVLDSYRLAFEARKALDERRWDDAFAKGQAALEGPAGDHAQQRVTMATIRTARGRREEARDDLLRATGAREAALRPFVQLAATYERERQPATARAVIDQAEASFGERPETMQARIRLLRAEGNDNLARATAERCQAKFPEQREQCLEPIGRREGLRLPKLRL